MESFNIIDYIKLTSPENFYNSSSQGVSADFHCFFIKTIHQVDPIRVWNQKKSRRNHETD